MSCDCSESRLRKKLRNCPLHFLPIVGLVDHSCATFDPILFAVASRQYERYPGAAQAFGHRRAWFSADVYVEQSSVWLLSIDKAQRGSDAVHWADDNGSDFSERLGCLYREQNLILQDQDALAFNGVHLAPAALTSGAVTVQTKPEGG